MITNETEYTDPFYNGSMDSTLDDVNHIGITLSGRKRKQDAAPDDTSDNAYEKITRRDVIQKAKDIAGNADYANEYLSGHYNLYGNKNRKRLFNRIFNKHYTPSTENLVDEIVIGRPTLDPTTLSTEELNNLSPEQQIAVANYWRNPNRLIGHIGGWGTEHPASIHGREYADPLVDTAVTGIGGAMTFTNPITGAFIESGTKGIKDIYNTFKWGLTTNYGRTAALKTAQSVIGGELVGQLENASRQYLNDSRIGNTAVNKYGFQPAIAAASFLVDPGSILENNLKRGITNHIAHDIFSPGAMHVRMKNGAYDKRYSELPLTNHINTSQLATTFNKDVIEEAFPFLPEYMHGLDPSITPEMAKEAFLTEIRSGDAFKANGSNIVPSGAEIVRRGLAKLKGYGNDGLLWMRGASVDHLKDPLRTTYSAMADPGVVDKYILVDNGTEILGKGVFNEKDAATYKALLIKRGQEYTNAINKYRKALAEKDKESAILALQEAINLESRIPSRIQKWNILDATGNPVVINPNDKHYDLRAALGQEYFRRLNSRGDYPMQYGLEFKVGDRVAEPIVTRDAADIMYLPDFQHVVAKQSKQTAESFLEDLRQIPEYKQIYDVFAPRLLAWEAAQKAAGKTAYITQDIINKLMSGDEFSNLATIMRAYSPDGTKGIGRIPIQSVTEHGFSKGIGELSEGVYNPAEKSILRKHGGVLNKINSTVKSVLNIE